MSQCSYPAEAPMSWSVPRLSVYVQGEREALEFKWIVSERSGYDHGHAAIRRWVREHWHGFLRHRWMEHLQGEKFWIELDHDDFGLLNREFRDSNLIHEVLGRLKDGWENLDILCWAHEEGIDRDEIVWMLAMLNINGRRLECQFADRLAQAS